MLQALWFDFGGTLDTDGVHWSEKYWEAYCQLQIAISKPHFEWAFVEADRVIAGEVPYTGMPFSHIIRRQLTLQFDLLSKVEPHFQQEQEKLEELISLSYIGVVKTMSQARLILTRLAQKYLLVMISNFYGNLPVVCREFGINSLFSLLIDSAEVGIRKPDQAIFQLALQHFDYPPQACAMIGDSYDKDIMPAKEIGCQTIWLKGKSWRTFPDTSLADHTIHSLSELPALLL